MTRYQEIDIIKGIAVVCMVIFHMFYFPNIYGFKEIEYDTQLLRIIAKVAQFIFIISVGTNIILSKESSKKKEESPSQYRKKYIQRILKISFFAI